MTIASDVNKSGPYNGNGVTTAFDYDFKISAASHVKVILTDANGTETTLTLTTDYSVSGVGNANGGQVTLVVAPAVGKKVTLLLNVPFTQGLDLQNQGAYNAEDVEAAFDLAAQRDQQLQEQVERSVKLPASADPSDLESLVSDIARLGDSADEIDTVAGNIGNVNAVAGNAANINTVAGISGNVTTVAGIAAAITAVAAITAAITTVAGIAAAVATVAGIALAVTTVAAIDSAVSAVAAIDDEVVTVANNVTDVTYFGLVYYGPNPTDPTTRRGGSALQAGDLYFNTSAGMMKVYDGAAWDDASGASLNINTKSFVGNGVQTAFTLNVSPAHVANLLVEVGGVLQRPTTDYTVAGTTLTLVTAPGNGVGVNTWVIATTASLLVPGNGTVGAAALSPDAIHGQGTTSAPNATDEIMLWDSVALALRRLTFTNLQEWVRTKLGPMISANTAKTTPVDADQIAVSDSAAGSGSSKVSFLNLWANYIKGKADSVYQAASAKLTAFTALANAAGVLLNDGSGNLSWGSAGGMTLLTTLTTTSGSTQVYNNIPAGYRELYCEIENVSFTATSSLQFALSSTNGAAYGNDQNVGGGAAAAGSIGGCLRVSGISCVNTLGKMFVASAGNTGAGSALYGGTPDTTTASRVDAIRFTATTGNFDAGTIRIYGVK